MSEKLKNAQMKDLNAYPLLWQSKCDFILNQPEYYKVVVIFKVTDLQHDARNMMRV